MGSTLPRGRRGRIARSFAQRHAHSPCARQRRLDHARLRGAAAFRHNEATRTEGALVTDAAITRAEDALVVKSTVRPAVHLTEKQQPGVAEKTRVLQAMQ